VFEAVLGHVHRAVRIHRTRQLHDLDHDTAPDQLEQLPKGVMLVDGVARVLFANAVARRMFDSGGGLALKAGFLQIADGSDVVQGLIASCRCKVIAPNGPGGGRSFHSAPAPFSSACDGDATAVKRNRRGTSLARLGYSRGHCHGRRIGL
jgi:hypothetical protein